MSAPNWSTEVIGGIEYKPEWKYCRCGTPIEADKDVCLTCEAGDAWSRNTSTVPKQPENMGSGYRLLRTEDEWGRPVTRVWREDRDNGNR